MSAVTSSSRQSWLIEGLYGLFTGVLFGCTSVAVGHPFSTICTKMQAQQGFEKGSSLSALKRVLQYHGFRGLYVGVVPPLCGSGVYRSVQFGAYEGAFTAAGNVEVIDMKWTHPVLLGCELRVWVCGLYASLCRAIIESPLEFLKVRAQVGAPYTLPRFGAVVANPTRLPVVLRDVYAGFLITFLRVAGALTLFFVFVDVANRNAELLPGTPCAARRFVVAGTCATFGWWVIWPLEVAKSIVQGRGETIARALAIAYTERGGLFGLYRGIGVGTVRSFLANGAAYVAMSAVQSFLPRPPPSKIEN